MILNASTMCKKKNLVLFSQGKKKPTKTVRSYSCKKCKQTFCNRGACNRHERAGVCVSFIVFTLLYDKY